MDICDEGDPLPWYAIASILFLAFVGLVSVLYFAFQLIVKLFA